MLAQQGFKEGCLKRIEVKDMAVNTLREMINYIYSGRFDEKTDVSALFSAAHLYAIPGLVSECEAIMIKTLTVENAAEFFFKAFLTEKTGLKSAAMSLISKKFVDVKKTEGWADFMKNKSSSLALEQILGFMAGGNQECKTISVPNTVQYNPGQYNPGQYNFNVNRGAGSLRPY
jgi:BTB/POZ domain